MPSYFRQVPNFDYVSRLPNANIGDYIPVKNIFKKGKLREDIFQDLAFFEKYKITGNEVFWGERDEPAAAAAKFKEFIRSETGFAYGPEFHPWRSFMVITLEEQDYDVSMRNVNIRTLNG